MTMTITLLGQIGKLPTKIIKRSYIEVWDKYIDGIWVGSRRTVTQCQDDFDNLVIERATYVYTDINKLRRLYTAIEELKKERRNEYDAE